MKVLYFIYSHKTALGGHARSLKIIHEGWEYFDNIESLIINIGIRPAPILSDLNQYKFLSSRLINFFCTLCTLFKIIKDEKPDILHAYDSISYFLVRIYSTLFRLKSFYTKCGGPNNQYTPIAFNTILFSQENFQFLNRDKVQRNLYLIPNRVKIVKQDYQLIETIKNKYSLWDKKIILRIGNIMNYYKKTIESAFRLSEYYVQQTNKKTILILIGTELDSTLILLREKYRNVEVILLNQIEYTKEAAKLITIADYNVATGRGAMESLGLKIPTYVYNKNYSIPVRIDKDNFTDFLNVNFSERGANISADFEKYFDYTDESVFRLYNDFLDSKNANIKLEDLYLNHQEGFKYNYKSIIDFFKNLLVYMRVNIRGFDRIKRLIKKRINA